MKIRLFAKYLPVEGQIYQGDRYFDEEGDLLIATCLPSDYVGVDKAALFLCSNEIVVGDKAHCDLCKEDFVAKDTWKQEHDEDKCYKIIGEILTPGIEDGQEVYLDEEQVQLMINQQQQPTT